MSFPGLILALSLSLTLSASAHVGKERDAARERRAQGGSGTSASASVGAVRPDVAPGHDLVSGTETLCDQLVEEAREIDRILHTISDKASADHAAVVLGDKLELMRTLLKRLERMPAPSPADTRTLDQQMSALTHITQGYIPMVQRLTEVNGYGSEDLLRVFRNYKVVVSQRMSAATRAEDIPQSRLYTAIGDHLEDVLYLLRKVQDREGAARAAQALNAAQEETARLRQMLEALSPILPEEQREAARPARERLLRLCEELKNQQERLRKVAYYGEESLGSALERYSNAVH